MIDLRYLRLAFAWDSARAYQLIAIARQLASLLIGIMVVKSGWHQASVGLLEQWFFLGTLLGLGFVIGTVQAFTALAPKLIGEERGSLMQACYLFLCAGVLLFLVVSAFVPGVLRVLVGVSGLPLLNHGLLYLGLHLSASLATNILLVHTRTRALTRYALCYLIGLPIALGIGLYQSNDLSGALNGLIAFSLVEHLYLVFLLPRWQKWDLKRLTVRPLLRRASPLVLYSIVGGLGLWFDGWLVNRHFKDPGMFALFRFGAREMPGALAMAGAFSTAMIAVVGAGGTDALDRLRRGSARLMHLFMPTSMVFMLISPWLYTTLYSEEFLPSAYIFNTYLLLMLSRWIFGHSILIARREERVLLVISLIELVINVLLSLCWVDSYGLPGIAFATVVAFGFEKAAISWYLWRKFEISPNRYLPLSWLALYSIALVGIFIYLTTNT